MPVARKFPELAALRRDFHLDRVILVVVNQRDCQVLAIDAVQGHAHAAAVGARLQDRDVVDRFPVSVVQLETLPLSG